MHILQQMTQYHSNYEYVNFQILCNKGGHCQQHSDHSLLALSRVPAINRIASIVPYLTSYLDHSSNHSATG